MPPPTRVLFVAKLKQNQALSPIIQAQADSLTKENMDISTFAIEGGSLLSYFSAVTALRKQLAGGDYRVVHAHYGLSALTAWLANKHTKLVISFMGDDLLGMNTPSGNYSFLGKVIVTLSRFLSLKADACIVKSFEMAKHLPNKTNYQVIPNGVNFDIFYKIINRYK